ncbi:UNVERIFIED_CONTAM: hypothetical protein HDU68_011765 [Siphonaria sp. JEL0065]|nr:hypothetical protein HDU68_011765 [Siphonaria sp. JEL0065]
MHHSIILFLSATVSLIAAHGGITVPAPLNPVAAGKKPALGNFKTVGNGCGVAIPANLQAAVTWTVGQTADLTFFTLNGDGAGPVTAKIDTTGKGAFAAATTAQVTLQPPGTGGNKGAVKGANPMKLVVPNTPCTNCLVQVKNAGAGFGSCVAVNIVAAGGAPAAAAASAPVASAPAPVAPVAAPIPAVPVTAVNPPVPATTATTAITATTATAAPATTAPTTTAAKKGKNAKNAKKGKAAKAAAAAVKAVKAAIGGR